MVNFLLRLSWTCLSLLNLLGVFPLLLWPASFAYAAGPPSPPRQESHQSGPAVDLSLVPRHLRKDFRRLNSRSNRKNQYDLHALSAFLQSGDFFNGKDPSQEGGIVWSRSKAKKVGRVLEVREVATEAVPEPADAVPEPAGTVPEPERIAAEQARLQVVSEHWLNIDVGKDLPYDADGTGADDRCDARGARCGAVGNVRIRYVLVSAVLAISSPRIRGTSSGTATARRETNGLSNSGMLDRFRSLSPVEHDGNVVLLHGLAMDCSSWLPVARDLNAQRAFQALAVDTVGHGGSSRARAGRSHNEHPTDGNGNDYRVAFLVENHPYILRKLLVGLGWGELYEGMRNPRTGRRREGIAVAGLSLGGKTVAEYTALFGWEDSSEEDRSSVGSRRRHVSRVVLVASGGLHGEAFKYQTDFMDRHARNPTLFGQFLLDWSGEFFESVGSSSRDLHLRPIVASPQSEERRGFDVCGEKELSESGQQQQEELSENRPDGRLASVPLERKKTTVRKKSLLRRTVRTLSAQHGVSGYLTREAVSKCILARSYAYSLAARGFDGGVITHGVVRVAGGKLVAYRKKVPSGLGGLRLDGGRGPHADSAVDENDTPIGTRTGDVVQSNFASFVAESLTTVKHLAIGTGGWDYLCARPERWLEAFPDRGGRVLTGRLDGAEVSYRGEGGTGVAGGAAGRNAVAGVSFKRWMVYNHEILCQCFKTLRLEQFGHWWGPETPAAGMEHPRSKL